MKLKKFHFENIQQHFQKNIFTIFPTVNKCTFTQTTVNTKYNNKFE